MIEIKIKISHHLFNIKDEKLADINIISTKYLQLKLIVKLFL